MRWPAPQCVLITGASGGIGGGLAREYAAPGRILILQGRDASRLADVTRQCQEAGAEVRAHRVDLARPEDRDAWFSRLADAPIPDLLILNAGITSSIGTHGEGEDPATVAELLEINLKAAVLLTEAVIPAMRRRRRGQIALISSVSAYFGLPLTPSYCASKAGMKAYGEALRGWLAPQGIAVSVVMPGFVSSAMSDQFPARKPFIVSPERAATLIRRGLEGNRARIAFPWMLRVGMWWLALLPPDLSLKLLRWLGYDGHGN
ncbi:MAG: SDR family NAD(P)-dependent oxidoreductase [Woeseiaceae bacterium]|nr:SDR family NAD(P)-dependent oxidoreductase [Woeseiaceae bacterium]